jgi:deferrochelatase/peroxidase EfeB
MVDALDRLVPGERAVVPALVHHLLETWDQLPATEKEPLLAVLAHQVMVRDAPDDPELEGHAATDSPDLTK